MNVFLIILLLIIGVLAGAFLASVLFVYSFDNAVEIIKESKFLEKERKADESEITTK